MGNSCLTVSSSEQTTFKWTIDGFSSLLDKGEGWTYSGGFEIMGMRWYLMLNPREKKSGDENEYVSMRLGLSKSSLKPNTIVEACFKFMIYDQSNGKHCEHRVTHNFETASTSAGIACMIPLSILKKQSSGFSIGDTCVFGVKFIKVVTAKANMISETHFVQKVNTFNESKAYTWNVQDFFALKNQGCSPDFEIGGYNWFISIYPSHDGKHLSLYLNKRQPNDLPKDSGSLLEFTLSIKDQEGDNHWSITGRISSNYNCKWGMEKCISIEHFKDPSNGYLIKSKCCIEAELAIVGSSKLEGNADKCERVRVSRCFC